MVARLNRGVYGTRGAGAICENAYSDALTSTGVVQGQGSPCCFRHARRRLNCVVHGDDVTCLGTGNALDAYGAHLQKPSEEQLQGGLGVEAGDAKEMRVPNRTVRVCDDGLLYEPDPKHVELMARDLGLATDVHPAPTPGIKPQVVEAKGAPDLAIGDLVSSIRSLDKSSSKASFQEKD